MKEEVKILFISPRRFLYSYPMLGLGFLTAYLKKYGRHKYNIGLADENIDSDIRKAITRFRPHIVGITATTPQLLAASRIGEFIKSFDRNIFIVVGGPHPTVLPEATLKDFKSFDIVSIGESEQTFLEIVDTYIENTSSFRKNLRNIKGIAYRESGQIFLTSPREFIENLDDIPLPDRDIFNRAYYFNRPRQVIRGLSKRSTHIMSSRGCPYDCIYCSSKLLWKNILRFHSPERVVDEIGELLGKFKLEAVFFEDDLFIADKNRVMQICQGLIKKGYYNKIAWAAQLRSNQISERDLALLKLMKEAGCIQIEFGFESGSERFLKIIKKNTATVEQNQSALNLVKKAGLRVFGNFIFGFQGETEEDMEKTKNFILKNYQYLDYFQAYVATAYPGTDFWNECVNAGIIKNPRWDRFSMGIAKNDIFSKTASKKQVESIISDLTYLSFKKIIWKEKLLWMLTRLCDDPRYVASMIIKNIVRQVFFWRSYLFKNSATQSDKIGNKN